MSKELQKEITELKKQVALLTDAYKPKLRRNYYSVAEFKAIFKVGDYVCGWSTGKRVKITAIGNHRFLGLGYNDREEVNSITGQAWVKADRK